MNEEREVRGHLENTGTPGRLTVCAFHGTRAHGEEHCDERRGGLHVSVDSPAIP